MYYPSVNIEFLFCIPYIAQFEPDSVTQQGVLLKLVFYLEYINILHSHL